MLEFSYQIRVFYGSYRGKRRSDGTVIDLGRDVDVFMTLFPSHSFWYRSGLLNSNLWKQQSRVYMKNNMYVWEMKPRVLPFELRNFCQIIYFIVDLLSKVNSFAYNLFDVNNLLDVNIKSAQYNQHIFQHDWILYRS